MVYVPLETSGPEAGEFLILDLWNSMEGLNMFFANPTVQEQAGKIFSQRDPVVWQPADGFFGYHFPAPYGRNDRIVGVVRGMRGLGPQIWDTFGGDSQRTFYYYLLSPT